MLLPRAVTRWPGTRVSFSVAIHLNNAGVSPSHWLRVSGDISICSDWAAQSFPARGPLSDGLLMHSPHQPCHRVSEAIRVCSQLRRRPAASEDQGGGWREQKDVFPKMCSDVQVELTLETGMDNWACRVLSEIPRDPPSTWTDTLKKEREILCFPVFYILWLWKHERKQESRCQVSW